MRDDLKEKAAIKEAAIKVLLLFQVSAMLLISWFDTKMVQIRIDENRYGAFSPQDYSDGISVSNFFRYASFDATNMKVLIFNHCFMSIF